MRLDNAPLLATRRDLPLFVDREAERELLLRNVQLGWNTLVLGPPGIGKTSLLNRVAKELDDAPEDFVVVQAPGRSAEVSEFLASLAGGLVDGFERRGQALPAFEGVGSDASQKLFAVGLLRSPNDTLEVMQALKVVRRLVSSLRETGARAVVIVDAVDESPVSRAIFARLRDELWTLGATWLVAGRESERQQLLQPPADAFFESVLTLSPLTEEAAEAFIKARLKDDEIALGSKDVKKVAELADGHPLFILAILRLVASGTGLAELEGRASRFEQALATVSPPARRLARSVVMRGAPGRTNDAELQASLGWSASRLRQLFHELVEAGAFEVSEGPSAAGPGRPSKAYTPRGLVG